MNILEINEQLVKDFCAKSYLSTYDPYDIWKTKLGFLVKDLFNRNHLLGLAPAAAFSLFDLFVNNNLRIFYTKQEYPIVRAWAALSLLNLYKVNKQEKMLEYVRMHLDWLIEHSCRGYNGFCWGLSFKYAVDKRFIYDLNTPLSTMTPYVLEAFVSYTDITGDHNYTDIIEGIYRFFDQDILVMEENDQFMVTSYSTINDRRVINAVSYTMYALCLLKTYIDGKEQAQVIKKINKLYKYIIINQQKNGSWLYSPEGKSFIDCFHSCIVLKNIIKTNRIHKLDSAQDIINKGYLYLKNNFYDSDTGLFKRFSLNNKPSLIKYDLYDNAEMLNLAYLMDDLELAKKLKDTIQNTFYKDGDIYSQIDLIGIRRNKNTLRWAVLPCLYAMSQSRLYDQK